MSCIAPQANKEARAQEERARANIKALEEEALTAHSNSIEMNSTLSRTHSATRALSLSHRHMHTHTHKEGDIFTYAHARAYTHTYTQNSQLSSEAALVAQLRSLHGA